MSTVLRLSPEPSPTRSDFFRLAEGDDDTLAVKSDKASQHSIPLSSPASSVQHLPAGEEEPYVSCDFVTEESLQAESRQIFRWDRSRSASNIGSERTEVPAATSGDSTDDERSPRSFSLMNYPPRQYFPDNDASSIISYSSRSSRKARPESKLVEPPPGPLVPGIALVDFNHLVGPKIEFADGDIFEDEQLAAILPFLALPDGAHLNNEDYSYFHLVPTSARPTTVFGISCNRQIRTTDLLVKDEDVTRSTVQKAVVVLASKPVFGPIRDRLGVVTRTLFSQRDFSEISILREFKFSLESSLRSQLTESALYMGTNLRELIHKFRGKTLLLLKALILQKRIMFYGHPVDRLCTYQYSLVSLIPGLLQNLDDCGSPPLASRAPALSRVTSLKSSDRKSLMAYLGLPLEIFGKDAFFQPYLPLQQVDLTKETRGYLCGCTNSIVTQQKDIDLIVNLETNTFEFRDPKLERLVALTAADRKWMDEIVKDVNDTWDDADPGRNANVRFKGSDDYLRAKFEEYVTSALASVKFIEVLAKSSHTDVSITGAGDINAIDDFNPAWIAEFKDTNAFEVWNRITDPMLFDIVEARHPCMAKPSVVEDIGLRLQEQLQELHLQEQLAPTREAISRTITSGSTSFFKAMENVRERWAQRATSPSSPTAPALASDETTMSTPSTLSNTSTTPVEILRSEVELTQANEANDRTPNSQRFSASSTVSLVGGRLRPFSFSSPLGSPVVPTSAPAVDGAKAALGSWGSSIGSFISQRSTSIFKSRDSVSSINTIATTSSTTGVRSTGGNQTAGNDGISATSSPPPLEPSTSAVGSATSPGVSSLFSSWTFSKASASSPKPSSPAPPAPVSPHVSTHALQFTSSPPDSHPENGEFVEGDIDPTFQPRDLGEFGPLLVPAQPLNLDGVETDSIRSERESIDGGDIEPGVAL